MYRRSPRGDRRARARGLLLLEVLAAVAVLALGMVALQRLVTRSVASLTDVRARTRAMFAAQTLLADAALAPPEPGRANGETSDGLRYERQVTRTPHPALREVRVAVYPEGATDTPCELVEVIRVAPR